MSSRHFPGEADPGRVSEMEVDDMLKETFCHFTWEMEKYYDVNIPRDIKWLAKEHKQFAKDYPQAEVSVYLLLSYLFTTGGGQEKDIDLGEADKYVDKVLGRKERVCGEAMVAIGNKMHIWKSKKCKESKKYKKIKALYMEYKKCDEMLDKEEKWHNPGDKANKSAIKLIQGYAFTIYDVQALEQAIKFYKEATELWPTADAYYRLGYAIDRRNRLIKPHGRSKGREIKALEQACELSEWKEPVHIVTYGLAIAECYDGKEPNKSRKSLEECVKILEMATEDCTKSYYINKRAHRAYGRLAAEVLSPTKKKKYWDLQHKYIERMLDILKECNVTLHEAGKFYWENPLYRNVVKARKLLESCRNYIWADIDLIKLESELDISIDKKRGFIPLICKYRNSKYCRAILYFEIGQVLRGQGVDSAFDGFLDDIFEKTQCSETDKAIENAAKSLEEMDSPDAVFQIGHVYYTTNNLDKAKIQYEKALEKAQEKETENGKEIAEAKERITELCFLLKCPYDCIQNGQAMCENKPHIKRMVAESYFVIGNKLVSSDKETATLYYMKSAELGLLDAGEKLLKLWKNKCDKEANLGFCLDKDLYEEGVQIYSSFEVDKSYWSKPVFEHRIPIIWEDRRQGLEKAKDLLKEIAMEHEQLNQPLGEVAYGENKFTDDEEQEILNGVLSRVDEEQNKFKKLLNQEEENESNGHVNVNTTGPSQLENEIRNRIDGIVWELKTSETFLNRVTAQKRRKKLLDDLYRLLAQHTECELQGKLKEQVTVIRKLRFAVTKKWLTQVKDDEVESANKAHTKYQTVLKDREVQLGCSHLLLEAKNVLEGSWFLFIQSTEGKSTKSEAHFPILDLPEDIPKKTMLGDKNWNKVKKNLPGDQRLHEYIHTHQATYDIRYFFLPEFNGLVNVIKHQACVVDQATGDLHTYYYKLAHQACVFVEDVVIELTRHWPSETATTGSATNQPDLEVMTGQAATTGSETNQSDLEAMPGEATTTGSETNQLDLEATTTGSETNQFDLEATPGEAATTRSETNQSDLESTPDEATTTRSETNQSNLEAMSGEAATTGSETKQSDLEATPGEATTTRSGTNQSDLEAMLGEVATTRSETNQSDLEATPSEATTTRSKTNQCDLEATLGEVTTTGSETNQSDLGATLPEAASINQPVLEDSDTGRSTCSIYDENEYEIARDHFRIAEALASTDKKLSEKLLFKSAELGLTEAGEKLFEILEKKWKERTLLGKELIEKSVLVLIYLDRKPKEDGKAAKIIDQLKNIMKQVSPYSGLLEGDTDGEQFTNINEERVKLTKEMMEEKLGTTVRKSFEVLKLAKEEMYSRLKKFIKDHKLADSETNMKFPILGRPTRKSTPTRSQKNMKKTKDELKDQYPYLKLLDGQEYKHIVTFLCEHQPTYDSRYNFLPILLLDQNEENLIQEIEKLEKDPSARRYYYDCAHSSCFMVEEFAIACKRSYLITAVVKLGAWCQEIVLM